MNNMINGSDLCSHRFYDTVNDCFLFQHVTQPTRYRKGTEPSVLDILPVHVRVGVRVRVYMGVCMCISIFMRAYVGKDVCICVCLCKCVHMCVSSWLCVNNCLYLWSVYTLVCMRYVYLCIYTCVHLERH